MCPLVYYILIGIIIDLSAPLADRPYFRCCSSFVERDLKHLLYRCVCLFSSHVSSSPIFFISHLVVTQIRGHTAGSSPRLMGALIIEISLISSDTLNYASAGPVQLEKKNKKLYIPRSRVDTQQPHTTGTNRSTHSQTCSAAVQQYV